MPLSDEQQLAQWILESRHAVAFTGAGISTESGIPDFRSPGGVWSKSQPVYFDDFLRSAEARHEYWRQKSVTHFEFLRAKPNDGHLVLAKWQAERRLRGLITQNIDGLHAEAGSRNVLELHGTARLIQCLDCDEEFDPDPWVRKFLETNAVPDCPHCGGRLKHATISFGQALDERTLTVARELTSESDLHLAIGSSLVVHPAAALPVLAKDLGARLVIINRDPTPVDAIADLVIRTPIGATLKQVATIVAAL